MQVRKLSWQFGCGLINLVVGVCLFQGVCLRDMVYVSLRDMVYVSSESVAGVCLFQSGHPQFIPVATGSNIGNLAHG